MAILKSDKFSKIGADLDNATATKLEFCAAGFPSQVQSHFSTQHNSTGAPVRKLQEALVEIQANDPSLGFGDDIFTSNFGGEIHGKVSNYFNEKLDVSEAAKEAHENGDDKPAHDEACQEGLNRMERKIISDLFSILPNE